MEAFFVKKLCSFDSVYSAWYWVWQPHSLQRVIIPWNELPKHMADIITLYVIKRLIFPQYKCDMLNELKPVLKCTQPAYYCTSTG